MSHAPVRNVAHARRRARKSAVQALYQWLMAGQSPSEIDVQFRDSQDMSRTDVAYFHELLHRIPERIEALEESLDPLLDRPWPELDPVERAILYIGAYELAHRPDIPFKVVIDEAVGLARTFGAQESHRYVNGVLDQAARRLRPVETGRRS